MSNICYTCVMHESHRCRNERVCPDGLHYEEYTGSTVKQCLYATVEVFQDGYTYCPCIESIGCEWCVEHFGDGSNFTFDESQNYERRPGWRKENGMRNCGLPEGYEDQCCLNRSGMCTLDTADFYDIDRAVGMRGCGFIGVNDRYMLWKYGVPYKEFICGSCRHYEGGTHGECTNEQVKPHIKGVIVDGEKSYIDSKEYYSGAHACDKFYKKGSEGMAKKTYYTKCGRDFERNSTAEVTGYGLLEDPDGIIMDNECRSCPFPVEVKRGWGENEKHVRWECRAGCKPPNHKTEWTGSLEDKNTINIHSLDHQLMEEIFKFCKEHPDLGVGYNADHKADCRRTLSISCSSNKKGIAAKKEFIEKFFPAAPAVPDERFEAELTCTDCGHFQGPDQEGSGICNADDTATYKDDGACDNYIPVKDPTQNVGAEEGLFYCTQDNCPFNDRECGCQYDKDEESDGFWSDIQAAVNDFGCKNEDVLLDFKIITNPDSCDIAVSAPSEEKRPPCRDCKNFTPDEDEEGTGRCETEDFFYSGPDGNTEPCEYFKRKPRTGSQGCQEMREDCPCFCDHNDGCAVLLAFGDALESFISEYNRKFKIDCDVYREVAERVFPKAQQKPEMCTAYVDHVPDSVSNAVQGFDYSVLDPDTATFLQNKVEKIRDISGKALTDIGQELKEAQERLAKHGYGCFEVWYTSLGYDRNQVYRLINRYNLIVSNRENQNLIESLPTSLVNEIAKPSTTPEIKEAVFAGDITTLQQWKDKEAEFKKKLADTEAKVKFQISETTLQAKIAADYYAGWQESKKLFEKTLEDEKQIRAELRETRQQLDQAKRNGNTEKVKELGEKIASYQEEIGKLNQQIQEKNRMLKEKSAQKISGEIAAIIEKKIDSMLEGIEELSDHEMDIYCSQLTNAASPGYVSKQIDKVIGVLNKFKIKLSGEDQKPAQ